MQLLQKEIVFKIDGVISFDIKELGKLYRDVKDITIIALDNLFKKNEVSEGIYLVNINGFRWQRIIHKSKNFRTSIKIYNADFIDALEIS